MNARARSATVSSLPRSCVRIKLPRPEAADSTPLPENLTPHKLRHTFASLLVALAVDPGSVMDQLGHADPNYKPKARQTGSAAILTGLFGGVRIGQQPDERAGDA